MSLTASPSHLGEYLQVISERGLLDRVAELELFPERTVLKLYPHTPPAPAPPPKPDPNVTEEERERTLFAAGG